MSRVHALHIGTSKDGAKRYVREKRENIGCMALSGPATLIIETRKIYFMKSLMISEYFDVSSFYDGVNSDKAT